MALGYQIERLDETAVVTLRDRESPVITLGRETLATFSDLMNELQAERGLTGVVLYSGNRAGFIAGADLRQLQDLVDSRDAIRLVTDGQEIVERWAAAPWTTVAAIHGAALGGGLEIALACCYRVASTDPSTTLGLPEVRVGLVPALGGTFRLPQLVGVERGAELLLSGRQLSGSQALRLGLVDELSDRSTLVSVARGWAQRRARSVKLGVRDRLLVGNPIGRRFFLGAARRKVDRKTKGNYPAPGMILSAVEAGWIGGRQAGLEAEAKAFGELVVSKVSRRLVGLFLDSRRVVPASAGEGAELSRVGIVGAGFMGRGIAAEAIRVGLEVMLMDRSPQALEMGLGFCRQRLESLCQRGKMATADMNAALARLVGCEGLERFAEADLIIEAVVEDLEVKRGLYADLEPRIRGSAVLGSNTSSLPIAELAAGLEKGDRFLGIHFFSPVHRMPLVEVVRHSGSSDDSIRAVLGFIKRLGKIPIVVRDGPGFYTSRILAPYLVQGIEMLQEGATVEEVDEAARVVGFPVGPLELMDEVGLDVASRVAEILAAAFPDRMPDPSALQKVVAAGHLGRKSGGGFYRYEGKKKRPSLSVVGDLSSKTGRGEMTRLVMQDRLLFSMTAEAIRCLEDGILERPRDGDLGAVLGLGYPPFTGGPFRLLDELGPENCLAKLDSLCGTQGPIFQIPQLLRQKVLRGDRFYH